MRLLGPANLVTPSGALESTPTDRVPPVRTPALRVSQSASAKVAGSKEAQNTRPAAEVGGKAKPGNVLGIRGRSAEELGLFCQTADAPQAGEGLYHHSRPLAGVDHASPDALNTQAHLAGVGQAQPLPEDIEAYRASTAPIHEANQERLGTLIDGLIESARARGVPPEKLPEDVLSLLRRFDLLTSAQVIDAAPYVPDSDRFRNFVLYRHEGQGPADSFEIQAFAWAPGQMTSPHGHGANGMTFIKQGVIDEYFYRIPLDWASRDPVPVKLTSLNRRGRGHASRLSADPSRANHAHALGASSDARGVQLSIHFYWNKAHAAMDDGFDPTNAHGQNGRLGFRDGE